MGKKNEQQEQQSVDTLQALATQQSAEQPPSPAVVQLDKIGEELQQQDAEIEQGIASDATKAADDAASALAKEKAAQAVAGGIVGAFEMAIKLQAPYVKIAPEASQAMAEKLAPVLLKHGIGDELPPWAVAWKEEIALGMVVAGVGFGIFVQVKQHKAEVISMEEARQQREQQQRQQQGAPVDLTTNREAA